MRDGPGDDGWVTQLRESSAERLRVEQRRDRIEAWCLFAFLWFFFSFWSLGLVALVSRSAAPPDFGSTQGIVEFVCAATLGLLVTLALWRFRRGLFPAGEPGLLGWLDSRRERR